MESDSAKHTFTEKESFSKLGEAYKKDAVKLDNTSNTRPLFEFRVGIYLASITIFSTGVGLSEGVGIGLAAFGALLVGLSIMPSRLVQWKVL